MTLYVTIPPHPTLFDLQFQLRPNNRFYYLQHVHCEKVVYTSLENVIFHKRHTLLMIDNDRFR